MSALDSERNLPPADAEKDDTVTDHATVSDSSDELAGLVQDWSDEEEKRLLWK